MTKLEPTRTSSDLTATGRVRELLDERGVEWRETVSDLRLVITWWESPTFGEVHAIENEDGTLFMACLNSCDFTPEQAIAATLGSFNCTNSERTDVPCHVDETEHVDISWQDGRRLTIHVMECSECGGTYEHVNGGYEFCPRCGRRIVGAGA